MISSWRSCPPSSTLLAASSCYLRFSAEPGIPGMLLLCSVRFRSLRPLRLQLVYLCYRCSRHTLHRSVG